VDPAIVTSWWRASLAISLLTGVKCWKDDSFPGCHRRWSQPLLLLPEHGYYGLHGQWSVLSFRPILCETPSLHFLWHLSAATLWIVWITILLLLCLPSSWLHQVFRWCTTIAPVFASSLSDSIRMIFSLFSWKSGNWFQLAPPADDAAWSALIFSQPAQAVQLGFSRTTSASFFFRCVSSSFCERASSFCFDPVFSLSYPVVLFVYYFFMFCFKL